MSFIAGEQQSAPGAGQHTDSVDPGSAAKQGKRILVVDDQALVVDAIRRVLELDNHTVETATDAHKALAAVAGGRFDLIILDYEMPQIKGDKLAAAIKATEPNLPIIMVTAFSEQLRATGDFPLAVDLVVSKPFDANEFRAAVGRAARR